MKEIIFDFKKHFSSSEDITSSVVFQLRLGHYKPYGPNCWYADHEGRPQDRSECFRLGCDCLMESGEWGGPLDYLLNSF